MTCRELAERLAAFLDGELDDAARQRVEAHLDACPDCQTYLANYRRTIALARDTRALDEPSEATREALVQAILAARGD